MDRLEAAKAFIRSTRNMEAEAMERMDKIERLRSIAEKCTSAYGSEAVQHSRNLHSMEDVVAKLVDLENETGKCFDEILAKENLIAGVLAEIPNSDHGTAVKMAYLYGRSLREIAGMLNVSRKTADRYVHAGLEAVADILDERGISAA